MSEPIFHRVVEIRTVSAPSGGTGLLAVLEDGSVLGGGMHGCRVEANDERQLGAVKFHIYGEVNP